MMEVCEPVPGVQHVIAEIFKERAMKGIRSRARYDGDLSAGRAPKLRRERRRLDAKLLQGIHGNEAVCPTPGGKRRQSSATALQQWKEAGDAKIGADAIHGEIVGVPALSVHAELPLVVESRGGDHHARRDQDQSLKAPAVPRNVLYQRAVVS